MSIHLFHKPPSSLTDDELMERVSSRDDDGAYGELYRRHARRLMGFFFRQTGKDEALAADLVQDAFLRLWSSRQKFSGSGFRTWLFTVSYNLLKNHFRHDEQRKLYETIASKQQDIVADARIIEQIDSRAFDLALQRELEKLPPEGRLLFSLRFEEELTVPQIAEVMDLPEGTVKSRIHALTQTLKQKLNPNT
ncbi:MAG: RNA polymerase sigma factor [Bacteroidaceae bacterium]|nr:RNA polymerase sigma factor [Bacteroidaceae bacterium]MBQ9171426.1 RNA polymerase sigma factor [Bacteroidaceae bacterium]